MKNFIWAIVVVAIIGLLFLLVRSGEAKIEPPLEAGVMHPLDHVKGNASSTVVLMEYSDFQCPACRSYYPVLRQVMEEFGDRIAFVYRHFPLSSAHPNADFAARASEAANMQGKFWEMHNLLFEKQNEWANVADIEPVFVNYATLLGLDVEKFKIDWRSKEVKNFVNAQKRHAIISGLQGTPTFFLNGVMIENPKSKEHFEVIINGVLSR